MSCDNDNLATKARSLFEPNMPSIVEEDHLCVACGYNLRTLLMEAICPECAAPVRHSFLSDQLVFSNTEWVRSLSRGTVLVAVGMVLFAVSTTLTLNNPGRWTDGWFQVIRTLVASIPSVLMTLGIFVFSRAETSRKEAIPDPTSRRVTRIAAIAYLILSLILVAIPLAMNLASLPLPITWRNGFARSFTEFFAHAIFIPVSLYYAGQIARRSSSPGLEQWSRVLVRIYLVFAALGVALSVYIAVYSAIPNIPMLFGFVGCAWIVVLLFLFVFVLRLHFAIRSDRKNAKKACAFTIT